MDSVIDPARGDAVNAAILRYRRLISVAQNVTRFDHDFWVSGFSSTKLFAFLVSLSSFDTQTQLWQGCTKSHPTPHSSTVKSFNSIHSVRNDRK